MSEHEVISAAVSHLSTASSERKIVLLSLLTHNLTISGRGVYSDQLSTHDTIEKFTRSTNCFIECPVS